MRRTLAALALLAVLASAARAATTSYVDVGASWVDLGAGPVQFQVVGSGAGAAYSIGDAPPAASSPGFAVLPQQAPVVYQGASHVYVESTYGTVRVVYGPVVNGPAAAPALQGTGGTSPLVLGTAVTSAAVPAPAPGAVRRYLFVQNWSSTATATFCTAASGITPSPGVAGCYTLYPNGGYMYYPSTGYVPQDAFNASASAANTSLTVEVH